MQNKTIFILSFLIILSSAVAAQKQVNSPYSRFNIGTLEPAGSFRSQGMGGLSISQRENTTLFFSNPASYSSIDTMSFVFDFGADYSISVISSGDDSYQSDDMNFDHITFGFPIKKGFGIAVGVIPYSNAYYNISDEVKTTDPEYDPLIGEYLGTHKGVGGLSNFIIGTGLKLNKYVSAGINMSVMFGEITRNNDFFFRDYTNYIHHNSIEKFNVTGVNFDYGMQVTIPLANDKFFNAGFSYTAGKEYSSGYEHFVYRYRYNSTAPDDTIPLATGNSEKMYIPGTVRTGVSFGKLNKLTAGIDFITTNWSEARIPGSTGIVDDNKLMFGVEYTPEKYSNLSRLKRVDYRLGGHIGKSYVTYNGAQVKETGISAGFGIPMMRSLSEVNIYFDYTIRTGSAAAGLYNERYFTVGASMNLFDRWFLRPKYN
ncbi:MAG TPA: hypothetical protein VHO50_02760 [Bacteroidales bacterium]|nr:hypothetical protein [Bacteroidales bacterium]